MKKTLIIVFAAYFILTTCFLTRAATPSDDPYTPQEVVIGGSSTLELVTDQPDYQLSWTVYPTTTDQYVKWTSSDTKVARVDSKGEVEPRKVGTCTITAETRNGKKDTISVRVSNPNVPVEGVEVNREEYTVVVGKNVQLDWDWEPSKPSNTYVKWTIEDNDTEDDNGNKVKCCYVTTEGRVYAQYPGDVTITGVTDDGGFEMVFYVSIGEANDFTYDEFEEKNPNLNITQNSVNEGVWIEVDGLGTLFYDNYNGKFLTGFQQIGGKWYYFQDSERKQWEEVEGSDEQKEVSYYYPWMVTDWLQNFHDWYYFIEDGTMISSSWRLIDNKWYYFDSDGKMKSGWTTIGTNTYYLNTNTANGHIYGQAIEGPFADESGSWYFGDYGTCAVTSGWKIDTVGRWYYAGEGKKLVANQYIQDTNGVWYYFGPDHVMLTSGTTPDGFSVQADGKVLR